MAELQVNNSRFNIIQWINDTLQLSLTKIQQLGAGHVYCQLLDAAFPKKVPMHKVKWEAKVEVEFLHNFKILLTSFEILGIAKKMPVTFLVIQVDRLAKARYQDNLEFVQWLKAFVQQKINYEEYEPLKRRNFAKPYLGFADKNKNTPFINKENQDESYMKSSLKLNASMRSLAIPSGKNSSSNLLKSSNKSFHTAIKTEQEEIQKDPKMKSSTSYSNLRQRSKIGPSANLIRKPNCSQIPNNANLKQKLSVSYADVILSEDSEDEVF